MDNTRIMVLILCLGTEAMPTSGFTVVSECRGDASIMTLMLDKVKVDPNAQHGREMHAALHVAAKAGESSATLPASAAVIH